MIVTSPDITALNYTALFDISGVPPRVVLANASTVVNAAALDWWFVITTPSGASIHSGSATVPDLNNAAFTTKTYNAWPMPMGQIEWGLYTVTAYVKDSNGDIFSLAKTANIIRPVGSTPKSKNNFGASSVIADMRCEKAQLYVEDTTNMSWGGFTPTIASQQFTLVYPLDATDTQPADFVLAGAPNGLLPVTYSGYGYQLVRTVVANYTNSEGVTVRIKYKYKTIFNVECDVDLCPLTCEYEKMAANIDMGTCDATTRDNLIKINALINIALIGKAQPLCGINVGRLVAQIKALGNFTCDCGGSSSGEGINGGGINGSSPAGSVVFTFDAICGDLEIDTYTQVGDNIVLKLKDKTYSFSVQAGATGSLLDAFSFTSTLVGCERQVQLHIDSTKLAAWQSSIACCPEYVDVIEKGTTSAPSPCPGSYFPAELWTPGGTTSLGTVIDINDLISKLITDTSSNGWASKGKWVAAGFCQVVLYRASGVTGAIPKIPVSFVAHITDPCVNNQRTYSAVATGYCTNLPAGAMNYPYNAFVAFTTGGPQTSITNVSSYSDLLTRLNAASGKPANLSFSADPGGSEHTVTVVDTNCDLGNAVELYFDTVAQVFYGAATNMTQGLVEGVYAIDPKANAQLGAVCGTKNEQEPWHLIKYGNYMYTVETNTGKLFKIDVSVPMYPVLVSTLLLPHATGPTGSFSPEPRYNGNPSTPSYYDVYFPTDLNSAVAGFLYIVESSSGSIWKYSIATDTVVATEYDIKLTGRCPRVILGSTLYLSQDGSREASLGISSGIARNRMLMLDLTSVGSGTLVFTTNSAVPVGDEPWAMSWDVARGLLWITTVNGNLFSLDPVGGGVTSHPGVWSLSTPFTGLANSQIYGDRLYVSALNSGTRFVELSAIAPCTVFDPTVVSGTSTNRHYNFSVPQGACYGMVTFFNAEGAGTHGAIAKYTLDGALMNVIPFTSAGNMYNVVPLLNVDTTTPNNLC